MAAEEKSRKGWKRFGPVFEVNPPWFEHVHTLRIVDFTIGVPANEGGTCDDGVKPQPDEEIRSAIFIQTAKDSLAGVLYEAHRWPGSSKFKLSVSRYNHLGTHAYLANDAIIGFIWKKDVDDHFPDIINSIPTPDPSVIYAPGSAPDGSDLPPQDSIE